MHLKDKQRYFLEAARWLVIATVVVPLVYLGAFFSPFITTKVFLFRTLVELALGAFLLGVAFGYRPRLVSWKRPVIWLPAALFLVASLASFFGIDPYHSFWSMFTRLDGVLTLAHTVILFYLFLALFREKEWNRYITATVVVSSLVSIVAILQSLEVPGLPAANGRLGSTIGNAAFLAAYLLMTGFLTIYHAWKTEKVMRGVWYVLAALQFVAVLMTATRGAAIALFVATIVALSVVVVKGSISSRRYAAAALTVLLLIAGAGFVLRAPLQHTGIEVIDRLASISSEDVTTKSRLFVWRNSFQALKERPLLGYGWEHVEYVYNDFYDPSVVREEWFDRIHNTYLDYALQGGILSFAVYAALIVALFWMLYRVRERHEFFIIFLPLVVAYCIQNVFVFDTINSSMLFFAVIAYVVFIERGAPEKEHIQLEASVKMSIMLPLSVLALAVIVSGYWWNVLPARANLALAEGYKYQIVDVPKSVNALKNGLSLGTFADMEYGYQAYSIYVNQMGNSGRISPNHLKQSYVYSYELLRGLVEKYPWNARLYVYLGHVMEAHPEGVAIDEEEVERYLRQAIALSPKRSQPRYMLANSYFRRSQTVSDITQKGQLDGRGIAVLQEYIALVPEYAEPKIILAGILLNEGEEEAAEEMFQEGLAVYEASVPLAKRIVSYYVRTNRYANAEPYFEYIVREEPKNYEAAIDLAQMYYQSGKLEEAMVIINRISREKPDALAKHAQFIEILTAAYNAVR